MSRGLARRVEKLEAVEAVVQSSVMIFYRSWDEWYPAPSVEACCKKWPELASREYWGFLPVKGAADGPPWNCDADRPGAFIWDCEVDDARFRPSVRFMTIGEFVAINTGDGDIESAECLPGWVRVRRRQMYEESGVNVAAFGREIVALLREKI